MKIGLARRGYSPTGGAENYLCRLADALEAADHTPVLFATPDWPRERWPAHRERVVIHAGNPLAFADALARLAERHCDRLFSLERVWRCDCYRAGDGVHRAWLERRAQVEPPWRVRLRHWNPKHRQLLALEESLFGENGSRTVIANSRLVRDEILDRFGGPPERIHVVYNGLPASAFLPALPTLPATKRPFSDDYFTILFAGTGWERKGLSLALAAVARLPESIRPRLLVAGRGDPKPYLRRMPPGTASRVQFLGPVKDMSALYAASDVFIAPTLYDPFSNACLEALAAGLPILTTPANGFGEILTPGRDGEVIASDDPDTWSLSLTTWAEPARLRSARADCSATAAPYTIEANVARTLPVLLDV